MTFTRGDARETAESLRPKHDLWNNDLFQQWFKEIETEIAALNEGGIAVPIGGNVTKVQTDALKLIGVGPPQNHEEGLRVYLILRGVVHFWRRKLGQLKSESERFTKLEKQLHDGRPNDVTAGRTGVSRLR